MGLVNRACFEAPRYLNDDSLRVDVFWHRFISCSKRLKRVRFPPNTTASRYDHACYLIPRKGIPE